MLTRCLKLPSLGSQNALPPAGWQQRTHSASVPDVAVGATNEAAVTLQTEAQSLSQNLTLLPHCEDQCANNARCPSRSVCGGQDEAVGCHPGLFYIRIESVGKAILTHFVFGSSAICRLFVQMSVYSTILLA